VLSTESAIISEANSILIIGGGTIQHINPYLSLLFLGTVGVELAAEIIERYPRKQITLVHSKSRLMERGPEKVSSIVEKWLMERNVKIIKGERIVKTIGISRSSSSSSLLSFRQTNFCVR
jgi:hypothetical protein